MSSISSMLGLKSKPDTDSSSIPLISFYGPNEQSQIQAISSSGQELARFVVNGPNKDCTVSRINTAPFGQNVAPQVYGQPLAPVSTQATVIATVKTSSLSEKVKLTIHGLEAKQKVDDDSLSGGYIFESPASSGLGKMKWKKKKTGEYTLLDSHKTPIAHGTLPEKKLEVFVSANELALDCFLIGWLALQKYKGVSASSAEGASAVADVLNAFAGN